MSLLHRDTALERVEHYISAVEHERDALKAEVEKLKFQLAEDAKKLNGWAKQAYAAGWKPPAGWKP